MFNNFFVTLCDNQLKKKKKKSDKKKIPKKLLFLKHNETTKKTDSGKTELFFTATGSDYFPLLLLSKFPKLKWKVNLKKNK